MEIPSWNVECGNEDFLEYFTVGLSGTVYQGLMHKGEVMPHIPLVGLGEISGND